MTLSPTSRAAALAALAGAQEIDVLVVGGGVVGSGSALDAATRGLSVGLVEARDFASGTSSRSDTSTCVNPSKNASSIGTRWISGSVSSASFNRAARSVVSATRSGPSAASGIRPNA